MTRKPWPDFGATGKFPRGKIDSSDEGELQFGIAAAKGNVIINFGKPVVWIGVPPEMAREMAASLLKNADEADKQR